MPQQMNPEQVRALLKTIDAGPDEAVKKEVFTQLGHACFHSNHLDGWVEAYKGDMKRFLEDINVRHDSPYWESLVYSADKRRLILTGKEVEECACPFAACSAPPLSLCNYCCKSFQQEIFGALLGRPVEVTITAAYLWGDRRCSSRIEIK